MTERDLLVCCVGSESGARELMFRFSKAFPRIRAETAAIMATMVKMAEFRYRVIVIAVTAEAEKSAEVMIRKLRDLGHSSNRLFVYCLDTPTARMQRYSVDAFGKDRTDELLTTAKKAAEQDVYCRWYTVEQIARADAMADKRHADAQARLAERPPARRSRFSWFLDIFRHRW